MPTMKMDMGGSAGVFYGFVAAILDGAVSKFNLHALLCVAENSVDSKSYRNDDIIKSYSGKTVCIVLFFGWG
jgi:probable aminopeptidase NPEPL1